MFLLLLVVHTTRVVVVVQVIVVRAVQVIVWLDALEIAEEVAMEIATNFV
ncbi:MAG: hypothetical protein J6A37_09305 [Oscillospiraceae bacterium]|nr:hypothetical protein [Oscillospiraceae bacterium]